MHWNIFHRLLSLIFVSHSYSLIEYYALPFKYWSTEGMMDHSNDDSRPRLALAIPSNTMQRSRRPSHLIIRSPTNVAPSSANKQTPLLSTTDSPHIQLPKTAPHDRTSALPRLAIQPATGSSLTFASPASQEPQTQSPPWTTSSEAGLGVSHRGSMASLSSFTGGDPPSPRNDTEGSNETIRRVEATDTLSVRPQSEYDGPYDGKSEDDDAEAQPLNRYLATRSPPYGALRGVSLAKSSVRSGRNRIPEFMHGVWLAVQSCVFLLVFGVMVSMTIWKGSDSDPDFWNW